MCVVGLLISPEVLAWLYFCCDKWSRSDVGGDSVCTCD